MSFNPLTVYKRLSYKPTVSVVLPSYNMAETLPVAIDSIVNQTYPDWELLVIDDGSSDKTGEALKPYINNYKIRIIHNRKNIGLVNSLNKGLKLARGKYIARLDADDFSFPDRLERQVELMEKEKLDLLAQQNYSRQNPEVINELDLVVRQNRPYQTSVFISAMNKDQDSEKHQGIAALKSYPNDLIENLDSYDLGLKLLIRNAFCHSSVMLRKSFLNKNNLTYTNKYKNAEDYELWLRMFLNGGKIAWLGGYPVSIYTPAPHSKNWFEEQYKSALAIRAYGISQITPDYNEEMLGLAFCDLVSILVKGNEHTRTLNHDELKKYHQKNCRRD